MKRLLAILLTITMTFMLTACGDTSSGEGGSSDTTDNTVQQNSSVIKTSPDKYTWYIKDYVGKNLASFGYTSMGGDRLDSYGEGYIKLIFVTSDGSYIDIDNDEELQKYTVTDQDIDPNTELKLQFEKDENGEEYSNLVEDQNIEEIVLAVKEVKSSDKNDISFVKINTSPDKYTKYIRNYVGRNLAFCGYVSLGEQLCDSYGESVIQFVVTSEDGEYVDISNEEVLKTYVVTGQNVNPNTELKLEFMKDENGGEYSNLVESQSLEEIELHVSSIGSTDTSGSSYEEKSTDKGQSDNKEQPSESTSSDGIDPEFKASMDSYEEFFNEYVDFMKKYNDSDDTSAMLSDYSDFILKYTETMQKFQEIDTDELNIEEALYYAEVSARITKKLAEIV